MEEIREQEELLQEKRKREAWSMIALVLGAYSQMLEHYSVKWKHEEIDSKYKDWERGMEMREEMGFEEHNFERIPKKKKRPYRAHRKHGH